MPYKGVCGGSHRNSMARSPNQRYDAVQAHIRDSADDYADPEDADRILRMANAYDEDNLLVELPEDGRYMSRSSRILYLRGLNRIAQHVPLTAPAHDINAVMQAFHDGERDGEKLEGVKDGGLSKSTVKSYQNAVRAFLKATPGAQADADDIPLFRQDGTKVDPEDMLTREEIHAFRNAANTTRDRALFDFLIYAGQRNTAARTLRIRDLDMENERFKLNDDIDEGLKGADENGKWRDLLLSAETIRQFLNAGHIDPDNPDAVVFHGDPRHADVDLETPVGRGAIYTAISRMAERAAEECPSIADKSTSVHDLRHNFVTIALRRGMPESAIKHQLGHSQRSQIMESTYAHLSEDDHIQAAREAFDLETNAPENELAPEVCPRCGHPPAPQASVCGVCHLPFTMDGKRAQEAAQDVTHDVAKDATSDTEKADADLLRELIKDDPDTVIRLLSKQMADD